MNFVFSIDMMEAALAAWIASLAGKDVIVRLAQNNITFVKGLALGAIIEADYGGYNPVTVSAFDGPFVDTSGNVYASTNLAVFTADGSGSPEQIYGVYLTVSTGAAATGTAGQTGGHVDTPVVTAGGSGYLQPPTVTITDATIGTGAKAHAVLTGDAVTSFVIDDPGTGYTGPIIAFSKPCKLAGGFNLVQPRSMGAATDGLPVVVGFGLSE